MGAEFNPLSADKRQWAGAEEFERKFLRHAILSQNIDW